MNNQPLYNGKRVTFDEYQKLKDDGFQYEIIEGVMSLMVPAPFYEHQSLVLKISSRLYFYVRDNGLGIVSIAPRDVKLTDNLIYQPDILFISKERLYINKREYVEGAPDFIVEVLSPKTLTKDIRQKYFDYEKYGVKEYWIINPDDISLSNFYYLINDKYEEFEANENIIKSKIISGFEIDLTQLARELL